MENQENNCPGEIGKIKTFFIVELCESCKEKFNDHYNGIGVPCIECAKKAIRVSKYESIVSMSFDIYSPPHITNENDGVLKFKCS